MPTNYKKGENTMKKIYVFGSANTDLVITSPKMPVSGETITGSDFFVSRGGKGANQAVAASKLGGSVKFCCCLGDDVFGKDALRAFKEVGIDVSAVRVVKGVPTGTAVIIVVDGDNRIILDKGANAYLSKEDADEFLKDAEEGDIYLTQLENPIDVIGYGLKKAKEKGMYVVLNPAPCNGDITPFIKYCDLITPNETELQLFGGEEELLKLTDNLLVTLGGKGFEIINKNGKTAYPCMKVKAVDTTAAGDTLCGGLVAGLSLGKDLVESAKYGSLSATVACTRKGAQISVPTKEEMEKYLK